MPLSILDVIEPIAVDRGSVVVFIPVHGAHDQFVECIRSVLSHTPVDVPILVSDDASPDDRSRRFLEDLELAGVLEHSLYYSRSAENRGFVATANDAFTRTAPADALVLNSDCVVTAGWFEAMAGAARQSTQVATVSVFTNHGTILSLPYRNRPQPSLPQTLDLDTAAKAIADASGVLHPRVPAVVGHCFYVRRDALELVGPFDLAFSPGYGEEVDFAQRCVLRGLVHVVADDAFVLHKGSASFAANGAPNPLKERHDRMIGVRYPYYYPWIAEFADDDTSPFARAYGMAERSLRRLTVSIDGRCLTPIVTGTQVHTLEVVAALSRQGEARVRVVVPPDLGDYAQAVLGTLPRIEIVAVQDISDATERDDVVHRPFQVSSYEDLAFLRSLGKRIVITHQDLIAFNNPGYFPSFEEWDAHRELTRRCLALADRVVFFSRVAAEEAIGEELIERDRAVVVYLGTDRTLDQIAAEEEPPSGVAALGGRPFLLCLGTNFVHKNRVFALRVLAALRETHDWDGGIVFAGPHVLLGSSASEEAAFLALHPELGDVVVDVAAVDEGSKRWLLRQALLMIYPSVHEGFGLVPFEAAEAGLACAFAHQTAIGEMFPKSLALIQQWNAEASADRIAPYLASEQLRSQHVSAVQAAAAPLTWRRTGRDLLDVYRNAVRSRTRESRKLLDELEHERERLVALEDQAEERHREFVELEDHYYALRDAFSTEAEGLVGPSGVIAPELQRALLAIGTRPLLRTLIFGSFRRVYRTLYRIRHLGKAP